MSDKLDKWINSTLRNYKEKHEISESTEKDLLNFLSSYPKSLEFLSVEAALIFLQNQINSQSLKARAKTIKEGCEIYIGFADGFSWVQILDKEALKEEGFKMKNCAGSLTIKRNNTFYALQDDEGKSYLHLLYSESEKRILDVKAIFNARAPSEYYAKISFFLEQKGSATTIYKTKKWIISGTNFYFINDLPEELVIHGSLDMSIWDLNLIKWPKKIKVKGTLRMNLALLKGDIPSIIEAKTLELNNYKGKSLKGSAKTLVLLHCRHQTFPGFEHEEKVLEAKPTLEVKLDGQTIPKIILLAAFLILAKAFPFIWAADKTFFVYEFLSKNNIESFNRIISILCLFHIVAFSLSICLVIKNANKEFKKLLPSFFLGLTVWISFGLMALWSGKVSTVVTSAYQLQVINPYYDRHGKLIESGIKNIDDSMIHSIFKGVMIPLEKEELINSIDYYNRKLDNPNIRLIKKTKLFFYEKDPMELIKKRITFSALPTPLKDVMYE